MKHRHLLAGFGMTALSLAVSTQLHAAQPAGLEEIIVTAQKRAESAQEIPIAIDVISPETFVRERSHAASHQ